MGPHEVHGVQRPQRSSTEAAGVRQGHPLYIVYIRDKSDPMLVLYVQEVLTQSI